MSTTLFACQWTLQKSGLRLPFIGWSANFAKPSLLFNTAQWAIKQPFWALCITVVYNCFKIWANICHWPKQRRKISFGFNIHPITHGFPIIEQIKDPLEVYIHSIAMKAWVSEKRISLEALNSNGHYQLECKAEKQNAFPQFQVGFEWVRGQWIHESFEVMRVRKCLLHYTAIV